MLDKVGMCGLWTWISQPGNSIERLGSGVVPELVTGDACTIRGGK